MSIADFPQIAALTEQQRVELAHELAASLGEDEKIELAQELLASVTPSDLDPQYNPELRRLLEDRRAYADAHPEELLTVEEFKEYAARQDACSKSES